MIEDLKTVENNLAEIEKDPRVSEAAWDEPEEDDEDKDGCYFAYLLQGWAEYDTNHHCVYAFSMDRIWERLNNVIPCTCDSCIQGVKP